MEFRKRTTKSQVDGEEPAGPPSYREATGDEAAPAYDGAHSTSLAAGAYGDEKKAAGAAPPARSSAFSDSSCSLRAIRRLNSATISSRKSSTSRSSYHLRNWVCVNVLFRTSEGVSGMCQPLSVSPMSVVGGTVVILGARIS